METKEEEKAMDETEKKDAQCDPSLKPADKQNSDKENGSKECCHSEKEKAKEEKSDKEKDGSSCSG